MIDLTSIQAAVSGLSTAGDLVKTILNTRDTVLKDQQAVELLKELFTVQSNALGVQAQLSAAIDEIRELKQTIMDMNKWDAEKTRYELLEVASRRFAYAIKETERGMEPAHQICANCYNQGFKSLLQFEQLSVGRTDTLFCQRCNGEIVIRGFRDPAQPPKAPTRTPQR